MLKSEKKPVGTGIAKTPVVMQQEELECGAACLTMILAYYGRWMTLAQLREECGVGRNGVTALGIVSAARQHGLDAKGCRMELEELMKNGTFPCIIHWEFQHFVVLKGFKGGKAYLNDPRSGAIAVPVKEFDGSYTGVCLSFSPSATFQKQGKPVSTLTFVRNRLRGTGRAVLFAILVGAVTSLIGIFNPAFKRLFTDYLITRTLPPAWSNAFIWILLGLSLIQILTSALSEIYNRRIGSKMAAVGNSDFIWKILKVRAEFFEQRRTGDLIARQQSNANISNVLINVLTPLLFQTLSMVFYFTVMLKYNWILACIGVVCMFASVFTAKIAAARYRDAAYVCTRERSKMTSASSACVRMIDTIKASGAEDGCFGIWAGMSANLNAENVKRDKLNLVTGSIPGFLSKLADMLVLALGTLFAMWGNMTVGMIMAFQGFLSLFMQPAQSVMSAGQTLQEIRTEIERVDDVMNYPDEKVFAEEDEAEAPQKLSGRVEMKNVTFGYSKREKPVISDFCLTLEPGKRIALVGKSGCGKSTLGKLLIGMHQPWSGEILFDGKPMSSISKDVFYASVAIVNQDVRLFDGTIQDNIKNLDEEIPDKDMVLSAMDAQVHDIIMLRPNAYHARLGEGGKELSGGQRQMIEIARALAVKPKLLILDEATSALDAETENDVVLSLRRMGISSVVIAHRLSTIRTCDEIIMLDKGRVLGRGTHDELMQTCEEYRALVSAV